MHKKFTTKNVDHLGLVAGMFDEIGIGDIIDRACGEQAKNKNLTFGQCVKCMILNGLGFVGRTLYLYSEYFEDKATSHLLGANVTPKQIDDNVLGRTLDKLFSIGVSELFTKIALQTVKTLNIKVKSVHLDSTSFHVNGNYDDLPGENESHIKLVKGYSKDHRPDLNQAVLHMITANEGNLPLFMRAASGNASDKRDFAKIVAEHLQSFQAAVGSHHFVGDSALYTPSAITTLANSNILFVTRVPGQIIEAKRLIRECVVEEMQELKDGYSAKEFRVNYGNVEQRWVVVFSEKAYQKEIKTFSRSFKKCYEKELKAFHSLEKEVFACEEDAKKVFKKFVSKSKYLEVESFSLKEVKKYPTSGRPKAGAKPCRLGYQISGTACESLENKRIMEQQKGFFILTTNDFKTEFSPQDILNTYKSQQSVERGFRFLKSPDFLVSSFYLKKPERIEALLMVMTLCLLVYAAVETKVRNNLKENNEFFPNQLKRPSQNPTSRWIFFCFLGLHLLGVNGKKIQITNLKERHSIILRCLGPPYEKIYYSETW